MKDFCKQMEAGTKSGLVVARPLSFRGCQGSVRTRWLDSITYSMDESEQILGDSGGQRSLVAYSPRGRKESDTTEQLHFHFHTILTLLLWRKSVS